MTFIPKFRLTSRLVRWLEDEYYGHTRLPKNIEEVFFKSKEDASTIANNLVIYAQKVHGSSLDADLENVIKKCPNAVVNYVKYLNRYSKPISDDLIPTLRGHGSHIADVAQSFGRLPKEYEDDIEHPEHFVVYISNIRIHEGKTNRIPEMESRIFDPNKFPACKVAECLVRYATFIGSPLPEELKVLLKGHGSQILEYATLMHNWGKVLDDDLRDSLAGDDNNLFRYAKNNLRKRLPVHLEQTMSDPQVLLSYAKSIVKGRLPEELENNFAKDVRLASQYAFEVIRGFACVRLPDVVHTAMIMNSAANPNDYYIKQYVTECERDTTTSGSW